MKSHLPAPFSVIHPLSLLDVDPQGDLTKMLGQRKPHDLSLTLTTP